MDKEVPNRIWIAVSPRGDLSCDSQGLKLQGVEDHREYVSSSCLADLISERAALISACNQSRLALAGYVSPQSAIDLLDNVNSIVARANLNFTSGRFDPAEVKYLASDN